MDDSLMNANDFRMGLYPYFYTNDDEWSKLCSHIREYLLANPKGKVVLSGLVHEPFILKEE